MTVKPPRNRTGNRFRGVFQCPPITRRRGHSGRSVAAARAILKIFPENDVSGFEGRGRSEIFF
jgi:hypothetical protein